MKVDGKTINTEGKVLVLSGEISNCTFNMPEAPEQMCFHCQELYEAYLLDDDLWNRLPKGLRDKFLCPKCFRKALHKTLKRR